MASKNTNTHSRPWLALVAFVVSILFLVSCGVPGINNSLPITPSPTSKVALEPPTSIPPTSAPEANGETPTSIPTTSTPQVNVKTPALLPITPTPEATLEFPTATSTLTQSSITTALMSGEIIITPGSTAAVEKGTIQPGQVVIYTVKGYQYQPLVVNVDSPNFDVALGVIAPDGTMMFDPAKKFTDWQVPLHQTGLYTIQVFGGATTENYILTVKLPKHVYIGNGTTTVTVTGATLQGFVVSYAINGNPGEILTVSLDVPSSTAYLDVFGVATGSLLRYTEKANSWTGTLSEKQLYVIEVIPRGGWTVNYSLTISFE